MKSIAIFVLLCASGWAENSATEARVQAGLRARQSGALDKAIAAFREASRLDPLAAGPRILLGSSLLEAGKMSAAIRELEGAVKIAPADAQAHFQLAVAYQRAGDPLTAVSHLRRCAELAPQDAEFAYQLGRAYLQLAEWCVEGIKAVDPRSARLYQVLGESYSVQGRTDLAIEAFTKAASAAPKLSGTHLALAAIYAQSGRKAEALEEVEREIAVAPDSAAAISFKRQLSGVQ